MTWLIPDALIVALSPMAVLPPVLYSDRPRSTGLTYLCGWLAGMTLVISRCTTAAPILAYLVASRYAEKGLERMRHWVQEHTATITAVTLTAVGTLLVVVAS